MGFRYRCQQCHNYQLCQDCFWRGHAGGSHSNQHQMKEYTSWVSQGPGNTYPRMYERHSECKGPVKMAAGQSRGKPNFCSSTPSFPSPSIPPPPYRDIFIAASEASVAFYDLQFRKTHTLLLLGMQTAQY